MTRSAAKLRSLHTVAAVLAMVAACTPEQAAEAPADTTQPSVAMSAKLPHPISYYLEGKGGEFQNIARRLYFGGGVVDSSEAASGGTRRARIIDAMSDANSVRFQDAGNGVVIARMLNLGPGVDPEFGMKPAVAAEYYVVVTPGTDTAGTWALYELRAGIGAVLTPARANGNAVGGSFIPCFHPKKPTAEARFGGCDPTHVDSPPAPTTSFQRLFGVQTAWASQLTARGAWVSCDAGCCELSATRR